MKKNFCRSIFLLIGIHFTFGCATLFKDPKSKIHIDNLPRNAKVYLNGKLKDSPSVLSLDPKRSYEIKIEKKGYTSVIYQIDRKISPKWVILDVFAGGWPLLIDAITENWYVLDTDTIDASLEKF